MKDFYTLEEFDKKAHWLLRQTTYYSFLVTSFVRIKREKVPVFGNALWIQGTSHDASEEKMTMFGKVLRIVERENHGNG